MDKNGQAQGAIEWSNLHVAARQAEGRRVVIFVPGQDALLTEARVPTRNRKQLLKAIPYALEEQLADDADELHFALGKSFRAGEIPVAVVARHRMESWLNLLTDAGLLTAALVPETLAVPLREAGKWGVLVLPDTTLVRTSAQTGFTSDNRNAALLLRSTVEERKDDPPSGIMVMECNAKDRSLDPPDLDILGLDTESPGERKHPLAWLATGYNEQSAINLLQGTFSTQESLTRQWRPWLPVAALLVVWLSLHAGARYLDYRQLQAESLELKARITGIYRETFPDTRKIVNPRVQMQQRLTTLRGDSGADGSDFLYLLATSGQLLHQTTGLAMQGINYRNETLNLDLEVGDLQVLDKLKRNLVSRTGLKVEIQSATAKDNRVRSRLQIGGPAS